MAEGKKHDIRYFGEKLCMQGESRQKTAPETLETPETMKSPSKDSMFFCGSCGRVSCDADRLCLPRGR